MADVEEPDIQTVAALFEGRYAIEERLPCNGLALVFRARRDADRVAVAVLPIDCEGAPQRAARFTELVAGAKPLAHPRIVAVRSHGVRYGVPWVEMDLPVGRPLAEELTAGPMAPERAGAIAQQILDALGYAHSRGVLHLDLTPANVLVESEPEGGDRVQVLGFGLAQAVRRAGGSDSTGPTGKGSGRAATRYLAPELLIGEPPTPRSDLYSVGALLHHMLMGEPPSSGVSAPPDQARAVLAFALAHAPADRFDSASAMSQALQHWRRELAGGSRAARAQPREDGAPRLVVDEPSPSAPGEPPRAGTSEPVAAATEAHGAASKAPQARRRVGTVGIALAAVAVAAGGVGAWTMRDAAPPEARPPSEAPAVAAAEAPPPSPPLAATSPQARPPSAPPAAAPAATAAPPPEEDPQTEEDPQRAHPSRPLEGQLPPPLADLRQRTEARETLSRRELRPAAAWARANPEDPRPHLLMARAFAIRGWNTDALERYESAWRLDESARHDPRMVEDLVRIAARTESGRSAERLLRRIYGPEALATIDRLLDSGELRRTEAERLSRIRTRLAAAGR